MILNVMGIRMAVGSEVWILRYDTCALYDSRGGPAMSLQMVWGACRERSPFAVESW